MERTAHHLTSPAHTTHRLDLVLTDVVAGLCLIYRKHKILDGRRIIIAEMQAEKQDSNLSLQSGGASTEDTNGNAGQDMIQRP